MQGKFKFRIVLVLTFLVAKFYFLKCWLRKLPFRRRTYYKDQIHKGDLPIRVLQFNILFWLETVSPDFYNIIKEEVKKNGLDRGINYNINKQPILHAAKLYAASISSKRKINVYETFNAYLWCICYSLLVTFEEVIQKPHLKGNFSGKLDLNNEHVKAAIEVFNYGLSLKTEYKNWDLAIPNPENFDCKYSYYVEKTNSLFVSAMFFILSHEIGHSYFNHVAYAPVTALQSRQEELDADNFAINQVMNCKDEKILPSLKYGAVVGMCSLLFLSPKLYNGGRYPDADDRIKNVMQKLELKELDMQWGIASLAFKLWGNHYGIQFNLPKSCENYSDLFYEILLEMNTIKKPPFF